MSTPDGYLFEKHDVARIKRMLDWFERRVEPAKVGPRRPAVGGGDAVWYELDEDAVLNGAEETAEAKVLAIGADHLVDVPSEASVTVTNLSGALGPGYKGARGIAVRCLGRLVSVGLSCGFATAVADYPGGLGTFEAQVKLDMFGPKNTPYPTITIQDYFGWKVNAGQNVFFMRVWKTYYHIASACPQNSTTTTGI